MGNDDEARRGESETPTTRHLAPPTTSAGAMAVRASGRGSFSETCDNSFRVRSLSVGEE